LVGVAVMVTGPPPQGVNPAVGVMVAVRVGVGLLVGVVVGVKPVTVGVTVGVAVNVGVGVRVALGHVLVGVGVGERVGLTVGVAVRVTVGVGVPVGVTVAVGVRVTVAVLVGVGVGGMGNASANPHDAIRLVTFGPFVPLAMTSRVSFSPTEANAVEGAVHVVCVLAISQTKVVLTELSTKRNRHRAPTPGATLNVHRQSKAVATSPAPPSCTVPFPVIVPAPSMKND